jgi:regulator of protease activity HflC (stomatin/prohibitin superfamily)
MIGSQDRSEPRHLHALLWKAVLIAAAVTAIPVAWLVFSALVRIEPMHVGLKIRKTGLDLPDGAMAAPGPDHKGIVEHELLPEGWHLVNPYTYETVVMRQVEVPAGKVGIKIRQFGKPLHQEAGQTLAGPGQKGVEKDILRPGRYAINTMLYGIEMADAVSIPAGYVGVMTRLAGREAVNPNLFVVPEGERGPQPKTLPPGTHYLNPYEIQVFPVDMRSHRFDMIGQDAVEFLSKDGFQIKMEATVEWLIHATRVPHVFVEYVDDRISRPGANPGEEVIKCIVEKVLLPNARAFSRLEGSRHSAREFISGETRQQFQDKFFKGLQNACTSQGIDVRSALVRRIEPPKAIADPIREREIAIRQRERLAQEMEREKQQKLLAKTVKLQERMKLIKQAEADVSVAITHADRQMEVALIEANRKLEVARLELQAARNQADAVLSKGQASADVLLLKNKAEAAGIRSARSAFGDGEAYARYLFLRKVAPAIKQVISNTEGPFLDIFRTFSANRTASPPEGRASGAAPAGRPSTAGAR